MIHLLLLPQRHVLIHWFFTGISLIVIPISTATTCGLSIGNIVIYGVTKNKYNLHKKQYEKDQQTIKSLDKLYRTSLQDDLIDKSEYERLCKLFLKIWMERKMNLFYRYE